MRARAWPGCLLAAGLLAGCTVVVRPGDPSPAPPPVEAPPPVTVAPTIVVIEGTQVAYVSNWSEDLFYYGGRWYRPYRGLWFRATAIGGPWIRVSVTVVPRPVRDLPRDYRWRARPAPPSQTVIVQPAPPPQQQTVIVQPPPSVVVPAEPPPTPAPVGGRPGRPARPLPQAPAVPTVPIVAAPGPTLPPGQQARVDPEVGRGRPDGAPGHAPAHGARAKAAPPVTVVPVMVPIPGSPVAFAENWAGDLFQYDGSWYRTHEGQWYRAASVSGDWTAVSRDEVPAPVREVPPDYRKRAKEPAGRDPAAEPPGQGQRPGKKKS